MLRAMGNRAAQGYIVGEPFEVIIVRSGWRGLLDRITIRDQRSPAADKCGWCEQSTPGYSWCSRDCFDAFEEYSAGVF
jgi:hypothetical protein